MSCDKKPQPNYCLKFPDFWQVFDQKFFRKVRSSFAVVKILYFLKLRIEIIFPSIPKLSQNKILEKVLWLTICINIIRHMQNVSSNKNLNYATHGMGT